jgi:hypothetical protein
MVVALANAFVLLLYNPDMAFSLLRARRVGDEHQGCLHKRPTSMKCTFRITLKRTRMLEHYARAYHTACLL